MRTNTSNTKWNEASVLASLRALAPSRRLTVWEAMRIAELQAARLLRFRGVSLPPVPDPVDDQDHLSIEYDFDMPEAVSGASTWNGDRRCWVIAINGHQPETRQRVTLLHEYKHILDHGHPGLRTNARRRYYGLPANEFLADYFAGCVLMPRMLVKQAWFQGVQNPAELAARFDVSGRAMEVRLAQLGLVTSRGRCHMPPATKSGGVST